MYKDLPLPGMVVPWGAGVTGGSTGGVGRWLGNRELSCAVILTGDCVAPAAITKAGAEP